MLHKLPHKTTPPSFGATATTYKVGKGLAEDPPACRTAGSTSSPTARRAPDTLAPLGGRRVRLRQRLEGRLSGSAHGKWRQNKAALWGETGENAAYHCRNVPARAAAHTLLLCPTTGSNQTKQPHNQERAGVRGGITKPGHFLRTPGEGGVQPPAGTREGGWLEGGTVACRPRYSCLPAYGASFARCTW